METQALNPLVTAKVDYLNKPKRIGLFIYIFRTRRKKDQDKQQLKLLSIFHYVVGGMAALIARIPIIQLTIGIGMLSGNIFGQSIPTDEPFPFNLMAIMFTASPVATAPS
jgi:hypothetical protein